MMSETRGMEEYEREIERIDYRRKRPGSASTAWGMSGVKGLFCDWIC